MDAEARKEEFQKYLEKNGVIDALTKVLVGLYESPEKPGNAVDFIKEYLGAPVGVDVEALKRQQEELQKQLTQKDRIIAELREKLAKFEDQDKDHADATPTPAADS